MQLDEEIKTKGLECERAEKRLEGLVGVKPKVDSEQLQLESELQHIYRIYVEKLRNNDYLEAKLVEFNEIQRKKDEQYQNIIKQELDNNLEEEWRNINDGNDKIVLNGEVYNYKETAKNKDRDQNVTRTNNQRPAFNNFEDDEDQMEEECEQEAEEDEDENF